MPLLVPTSIHAVVWEGVVKYRLWCWRSVFAFAFGGGGADLTVLVCARCWGLCGEEVVKYMLWCWRSIFASDLGEGCWHYGEGLCSLLGGCVVTSFLYLFGFCLLHGCCLIDMYTYLSLFLFMPLPPTFHAFHSLCIYWMKTRSERRLAWTIMREKTIIIWISMYRSRVSKCTVTHAVYSCSWYLSLYCSAKHKFYHGQMMD